MTTQAFKNRGITFAKEATLHTARMLGKALRSADITATKVTPALIATCRVIKKVSIIAYDMVHDDINNLVGFVRKHKWESAATVASTVVGGMATSTIAGATVAAFILSMTTIATLHYLIAKRKKQAMDWRMTITYALLAGSVAFILPWATMAIASLLIFVVFFALKVMLILFVNLSALFMI